MNKKRVISGIAAMAVALGGFAGCTKKDDSDGTTEVSWYLSGVKQDSSYDEVFNKANELLEERYGLKLNIILTDGSNYSQKIQMINASREAYDLAFTCNWTNNYYTNVENGSLLDITELLPKEAPELYKSLSEAEIQATKVGGKMYAVPNWQVQARALGILIPEDKLTETGYTLDQINRFEDLEGYLKKMVSIDPESNKTGGGWNPMLTYYGMMTVVQEGLPGCIYYQKEGKPQIVNQFDTPEFMEFAKLQRDWVKKGLLPSVKSTKNYAVKELKKNPVMWINWKPGIEVEQQRNLGYPLKTKQLSPAVLGTEVLLSTMTGVGANSKRPEKALKVLEVMHTDKEIYNLLSFGIEGKNYDKVSDNKIKIKDGNTYSMSNWMLGSVMNSYILDGNPDDIWEKTKEFNDSAIVSPLIGFSLDNSKISAELGNCETVIKQYLDTIQFGLKEPDEIVPQFLEELKIAGADKIVSEVQSQVDEWWENK